MSGARTGGAVPHAARPAPGAVAGPSLPSISLPAADRLIREGRIDEVFDLIFAEWIGVLTGPSPASLQELCRRLPKPYDEDPRILIVRACIQDALGANTVAQMLLRQAQTSSGEDLPGLDWMRAFAQMILLDDRAAVRDASRRVWKLMGEGVRLDSRSRVAALHHLGWAYLRHRSDPEIGIEILEFARQEAADLGDEVLQRRSSHQLAFSFAWAGRLRSARRMLDDAAARPVAQKDYHPWRLNSTGDTAAAAGMIAYWSNDLGLAQLSAAQLETTEVPVVSFDGLARLMLFLTAVGSRDEALIRKATVELQEIPSSDARGVSWEAYAHLCSALLAEVSGNRERAISIARRYSEHQDLPVVSVVLAGVLRRSGKPVEALRMLRQLHRYKQFSYIRVATLATAAVVQAQEGNVPNAHELCERALDHAARENVRRPFCEWDLRLRQLLTAHLSWGTRHEAFITECLTDHRSPDGPGALSQRERTVFAQLRTIRTVPEIAEHLGVSVNTVKSHLKSIYRKLGVTSRRDAVQRFLDDSA